MDSTSFDRHLTAALDWIWMAYEATGRQGLSAGFDIVRQRWKPAYPETTGYTIPTLFECAKVMKESRYFQLAVDLADYELAIQMESGAIPCLTGEPIAFDTGQVIFGWLSAYRKTHNTHYGQAAIRAADWLVREQSADGVWHEHQHRHVVKTIDARVAWALLESDRVLGETRYEKFARRNLDWVISQQLSSGWFQNCSLGNTPLPSSHTLAYTIEGLLESGLVLKEERYVEAARRSADVLLSLQMEDGFLAGEFDHDWNPSMHWSCLTGNVQMALIWFRLFDLTHDSQYRRAACSALNFVRRKQNLRIRHGGVMGAIPGSFPMWGRYERFKFPNWATKFYIDALFAERSHRYVPKPATKIISAIIVNWNTRDLLEQCLVSVLDSLSTFQSIDVELFVVDNASVDGSVEMARAKFPQVQLIENNGNLGFARANNRAIEKSAGRYILLLNSDTIIQPDALGQMVRFMDEHSNAGLLGAYIVNRDGTPQWCFGKFPTLLSDIASSLGVTGLWPLSLWLSPQIGFKDEFIETDWAVGAALMVRRDALGQVGLLDEDFFMYSEEMDLARRLKHAGWKNYVLGTARIVHIGRQSSQIMPGRMKAELYRSKVKYYRKHHGEMGASILKLVIVASLWIKCRVWSICRKKDRVNLWTETSNFYNGERAD